MNKWILCFIMCIVNSVTVFAQDSIGNYRPKISISLVNPNTNSRGEVIVKKTAQTFAFKVNSLYPIKKVTINKIITVIQADSLYERFLTLKPGKNMIEVAANDGYIQAKEKYVVYCDADETAPEIELISPILKDGICKTELDNLQIHFRIKGDIERVKHITVNGFQPNLQEDETYRINLQISKSITPIEIRVQNLNNQEDVKSFSIYQWKDLNAPSISLITPNIKKNESYITSEKMIGIKLQIKDESEISQTLLNGEYQIVQAGILEKQLTLKYGINNFELTCQDKHENIAKFSFTVLCQKDNIPPQIQLLVPQNIQQGDTLTVKQEKQLLIAGIVAENEQLYDFSINSEEISLPLINNGFSRNIPLKNGLNLIEILATDQKQNQARFLFWVWRENDIKPMPKIALVIGNANYIKENKLQNPINDAEAMRLTLEELNFEVRLLKDATKEEMEKAIKKLKIDLSEYEAIGVFYFAGHGIQYENTDYLIPIDADFTLFNPENISSKALRLSDISAVLGGTNNPGTFMFIDACRSNQFMRDWKENEATRSISNVKEGLAESAQVSNQSIIFYATQSGKQARDGENAAHSPFTAALLTQIKIPNLGIEELMKQTMQQVKKETGGYQSPHYNSNFDGEFIINPKK